MRDTYYLKISRNHLWLRHLDSGREAQQAVSPPFSNARLLVAEFTPAALGLKALLAQLKSQRWLVLPGRLLIQPLECLEGGLSEIETRILLELGRGSGMHTVRVHVGAPLDDASVRAQLRA